MTHPRDATFKDTDIADVIVQFSKAAWKAHQSKDWSPLTSLYGELDPSEMATVEIIAYLRSAATCEDKISTWKGFLDRSRVELTSRVGDRAEKMLRNL